MNDTLGFSDIKFAIKENIEMRFSAKSKQYFITNNPLDFNGCYITLNNNKSIYLRQKQQGERLENAINAKIYMQ